MHARLHAGKVTLVKIVVSCAHVKMVLYATQCLGPVPVHQAIKGWLATQHVNRETTVKTVIRSVVV